MSRKKNGNGKYQEWITEEGLLKIEGWARDGLTDKQIAHNIGIAVSTLNNWKNNYVELMESLKRGKEVIDRQVENALLKRALGYTYTEVKTEETDEYTKTTRTIKEVVPDTTAQIFWLKNRKPDVWRDRPKSDDKDVLEKLDKVLNEIEGVF